MKLPDLKSLYASCETCNWSRIGLRMKIEGLAVAHLKSYRDHIVILTNDDLSTRELKYDIIVESGDKPPF
jgi:hypothetical protein